MCAMRRSWAIVLLLVAAASEGRAQPVPSVLVTTVQPVFGTLPDRVEAYGLAMPQTEATQTLSLLQDGRVRQVLRAPGEAVQEGSPIMTWEASALARQGWEQARTALSLAQKEQMHAALLLTRHLGTREQLDQADKSLADAQAAVDALHHEQADRPEQTIVAPFDGTILTLPVAPGERVLPGAALVTLARTGSIVVKVGVEPNRLPSLRPGQAATVRGLWGEPARSATVMRVDAVLDPRTRLVNVDLLPDAGSPEAGQVLPGSAMRSEITVGTLSGWLVPHEAVLEDVNGAYLFQVSSGRASLVKVEVRGIDGDTDLVNGAIYPTRPIIRTGASQLSDGAPLRDATAR